MVPGLVNINFFDILTSARGIMCAQPLRAGGHPLAAADYHKLAAEQRVIDLDPGAKTKPMFMSALERLAAES